MPTAAAERTRVAARHLGFGAYSRAELLALGCSRHEIAARIAAHRWRLVGRAVVVHNGELTTPERWRVGVINCGPRAVLASFSAAERCGLTGWAREDVHVLAPAGVARPTIPGLSLVLHRTGHLDPETVSPARRCQRLAFAVILAASSFASARPACGLLAASVQQRLTSATALAAALQRNSRSRHRAALVCALGDIEQGSETLSELDFVRLCRRNGLPEPTRQVVRVEPGGRRRYLDVEWVRPDGSRLVAEIDGAVHLTPRRWFDDQLRQNELALTGSLVLRFPSVVVRTESELVVRQLRHALLTRSRS